MVVTISPCISVTVKIIISPQYSHICEYFLCNKNSIAFLYSLSNFTVRSPDTLKALIPSPSMLPIRIKSLLCDHFL